MGRPNDAAPPPQANVHAETAVGMDPLPVPEGVPSDFAPAFFEALDPPPPAADVGIDRAMGVVPDLDFFDL